MPATDNLSKPSGQIIHPRHKDASGDSPAIGAKNRDIDRSQIACLPQLSTTIHALSSMNRRPHRRGRALRNWSSAEQQQPAGQEKRQRPDQVDVEPDLAQDFEPDPLIDGDRNGRADSQHRQRVNPHT
jgi:hypothetical protein